MVSYIMKRHQSILLLSTMHYNDAKRNGEKGNPDETKSRMWKSGNTVLLRDKIRCRCCKPSSTGKHKQATHPTVANDALLQCVRFRGTTLLVECGKTFVDIRLDKPAASAPQSLPYTDERLKSLHMLQKLWNTMFQ
ncbi:hypothetical protein T07_11571 [Trichinella nelsoni]|uniref:Uncharacterized protein n=1 Tax=Trichinella nelsoni TaxID=6336 RepID=A0A0V0RJE4_9BILA|nr:hypothetical protein T07_11571 [Trichinella nelsoni]